MSKRPTPRISASFVVALLSALLFAAGSPVSAQQADDFDFDDLDKYEKYDKEKEDKREKDEEEFDLSFEEEQDDGPPSPYGDIEELIVTGSASSSLGDLTEGNSIAEFSGEDLEALGAQDITGLAAFTPNLEIVAAGATSPTLFIRGVGLNDFNANSSSAVAVFQDDVLRNSQGLQLPSFFDVQNVNVLRGPQGYGSSRNASAGAIKLYSAEPSGEVGGFLRSDLGNFNALQFEGAIETPIVEDMLRGRVAFTYARRDGWMRNRCANAPAPVDRVPYTVPSFYGPNDGPWSICGERVARNEISPIPVGLAPWVNDQNHWAMRGSFIYEPTDWMRFRLITQGQRIDQYSNLGQAYGTGGVFTCIDGDVFNCFPGPGSTFPPGSRSQGALGGFDTEGYQTIEVRDRLTELAPCLASGIDPINACRRPDAAQVNDARVTVANELAQQLDSEPFVGDFNRTGRTTNDTWGFSVKSDFELPKALALTYILAYDTYDRTIDIDLDQSPNTLFHIVTDDELWQVYQDLKLTGDLGEYAFGTWDVGGYMLVESLHVNVVNDLGTRTLFGTAERDYTQNLYSFGVYVDTTVDFWENFVLDAGFRWNLDRKTIDYELEQANFRFTTVLRDTWQAPTGGIRLTYNFNESTLAYWKYTRGWKGGHYNATSSDIQQVSIAAPETNNAIEVGMRATYFDDLLQVSGAFFYYAYDNYQIFTAQQFLNSQPEFVIINANNAENYGIEADISTQPWEGADFGFNFGWLESQFLDFVQEQQVSFPTSSGQQVIVTKEIQNSGNPLLNSPRFNFTISLAQQLDFGRYGSITPRYDGSWKATTYYDATAGRGIPNNQGLEFLPPDTIAQAPYWLHNARLTYRTESGNIEFSLWGRNLGNQVYKSFAFDGSTFNNTTIYYLGLPRTFGGSLGVTF